ncbi:MAG: AIPR family protein [Nautiliaceae bacterium]
MDMIVQSYLDDFKKSFGFNNLKNDKLFEKFVNYILINDLIPSGVSPEDLSDNETGTYQGIDGIFFIVNGRIINSKEELIEIVNKFSENVLKIIFIQSKTTPKFELNEIRNFGNIVKDFLGHNPKYSLTSEAKQLHEIFLAIVKFHSKFKEVVINLYFATTGLLEENKDRDVLCDEITETITILGISKPFDKNNVFFNLIDKQKLLSLYDKTKYSEEVEIEFKDKTSLDVSNPNIKEAYIGWLPWNEYKKILINERGEIRNLFYDNVRDFLGIEDNEVNKEIKRTIENIPEMFHLLNNGVTIISDKNERMQEKFRISNFQIVNGCQTSNVLYEIYKEKGDFENLKIPVRLIITEDEDIKNSIIIATNSQNKIPEEQLSALTSFQKELEKYYEAFSKKAPFKIYYERRANQYNNSDILKKEIIDLREQLKLFSSIFLEIPHIATSTYSKVYRENKRKIFLPNHRYEPYFFGGVLAYFFRHFLNTSKIDRKYNKARYHLFLMVRLLIEEETFEFNKINSEKYMNKYFKNFFDNILDKDNYENYLLKLFNRAISILENGFKEKGLDLNNQREFYKKDSSEIVKQVVFEYKRAKGKIQK